MSRQIIDKQAEMAVVGSFIKQPDEWQDAYILADEQLFCRREKKAVYEVIKQLRARGESINELTIAGMANRIGVVVTNDELSKKKNAACSGDELREYLLRLKDVQSRRRVAGVFSKLLYELPDLTKPVDGIITVRQCQH